jgi:hexosaminidase
MRMTLGDTGDLQAGLEALAPELGITFGDGGVEVRAVRWDQPELRVTRRAGQAEIHYRDKPGFFRGVGLLAEHADGDLRLSERVAFRKVGPMVDVSQGNAVPRLDFLRGLLRKLALMGLNLVMLYCEDSYEVPRLPFFGYMRGRLRSADLRALDDYADMLGIELIPCIQTLGHLYEVLKWDAFAAVRDDAHTLLVGEPQTYQLIEHMVAAASEPVRSRRIHIGMDEAWNLGLGAYLVRNGYRPKIDIMAEHLPRVIEIAQRLGLRPMMWSDMFFRATSPSNSYDEPGSELTEPARTAVPAEVDLVYWSYHNGDTRFYRDWIERHVELARGRTPVFAGGISNWRGWAPNYGMSLTATKAALAACESMGVEEVLATLWGDDGTECDLEACLLGLQFYAESCYGGDTSDDALSRRFATCCGGDAADFLALKDVDEAPGVGSGNPNSCNPSEYLLWQHPMLGLFDANVRDLPMASHYEKLARQLVEAAERNPRYRDVFTIYQKLCAALAVKADLGTRLVGAYGSGDREGLRAVAERDLPAASAALRDLRDAHMRRWYAIYQPFGWEVIDARYGAALLALDAARWRIGDYLDGRAGRLEELEEPRLPFNGVPGPVSCQYVGRMQSASRLFWDVG